jgi:hypothetical protein
VAARAGVVASRRVVRRFAPREPLDGLRGGCGRPGRFAQTRSAVDLVEAALEWSSDLPPDEAADLYCRVGGYRTYFQHPRAGLPLLDQSISLHEQLPPSAGYLRALRARAEARAQLGRSEEAAADLATAVEVSLELVDQVEHRRWRVEQAHHDYLRGDRTAALARIAALAALELPSPDPLGDIEAGAVYTDLLLLECADADAVEVAGRRGLQAAGTWGITYFAEAVLRINVAEAARREGQVARAAALIDPATEGSSSQDRGELQMQRALLDALRGDTRAVDRLLAFEEMVPTIRAWFVPCAAQVELWCRQPQRALDLLLADLDRRVSAGDPAPGPETFMLTARAAADVVTLTDGSARQRQRDAFLRRLRQVRAATDELPVDNCVTADVSRPATEAAYAAEMARLADRQIVEVWVVAATEWDKINRPHESAYCRWRAAQVALAAGQASMATTLLRRAARQAREHVPLLAAIAATGQAAVRP